MYYQTPNDTIGTPNENAKILSGVLSQDLILLNCLAGPDFQFSTSMTFRQKQRVWVSELDHIYVSNSMISAVECFSVNADTDLPSNHAPVTAKINVRKVDHSAAHVESLELRARQLGDYSVAHSTGNFNVWKQMRWSDIDVSKARQSSASYSRKPGCVIGIL